MRSLPLVTLLCAVSLNAQERILGLVEIPALAFEALPAGEPSIPLWAEPSAAAEKIADLRSFDHIEFREHGYEERSAAFYETRTIDDVSWYRIRLAPSGRLAWISGEIAGAVHWPEILLQGSLAYLTDSWDKRLRLNAGKPETDFLVPVDEKEPSIAVAGTTRVDGEVWLLIVITGNSCEGDAPAVVSAGWVPLYAADNSLNVWFYSRGC